MTSTRQKLEAVPVTDENFDEEAYLASNPDVAEAVLRGHIRSGRIHFERFGRNESRQMTLRPRSSPALRSLRNKAMAAVRGIVPPPLRNRVKRLLGSMFSTSRLRSLGARLQDSEVLLEQLLTILQREAGLPPPPPKHLQVRVSGGYTPDFIESGFSGIVPALDRALQPVGKALKDFPAILDFGCGCGRAIRALAGLVPGSRIHGTDIDPEAIGWLQRNYSRFGEFSVAPHVPPTVYEARSFDLVFGVSVFTHLPEDLQFLWLEELARILKPNGCAILTTHGEGFYNTLDAQQLEVLKRDGFYYGDFGFNYGESISLPDFYQTAFHMHGYIRKEWNRFFEVVEIRALGFDNFQDTVLLRGRG